MIRRLALAAALSLAISPSALADAEAVTILKPDMPAQIGEVETVCTGVGLSVRQNPVWAAYPLKIEIAGRGGQYLADIRLTLSRKDKIVAAVTCDGPWVLFKTAPGVYRVEVSAEGQTASSNAYAPALGQGRIIIRFPMLGGDVGPMPSKPTSIPVTN